MGLLALLSITDMPLSNPSSGGGAWGEITGTLSDQTDLQAALDSFGEPFPVGSVFLSVVSTDPATLLGYGTWSAIAAGKVLIGLDSGDADFDTAEETGGTKTVTSTGAVSTPTVDSISGGTPAGTIAWPAGVPTFAGSALAGHTHTFTGSALAGHTHTFTGSALGTHTHTFTGSQVTSGQASAGATSRGATASTITIGTHTHTVTAAGTLNGISAGTPAGTLDSISGGTPAGTLDSISGGTPAGTIAWPVGVPTFTGGALGGHTHTVSTPTYTGNATSVVQPYFVVYMWKRTA